MSIDPVVAAAWSAIVEPGDHDATSLWQNLGPDDGLAWMRDPLAQPLPIAAWEKLHRRTHPRAAVVRPEDDLIRAEKLGVALMSRDDPLWPERLAQLGLSEPLTLWTQGDSALLAARQVSIVGARASTGYGNRVAEELAWDLAAQGIVVTSGGAYGIDAAAHRGALGQGSTVAVLCGGLGNLYPRGNLDLLQRIGREGLLITEVPPGARPARWRFLERNRVIAALAEVVVVVEAGRRSGALATANRAAELACSVAAVPGPVTSAASSGCLDLLREGAALVRNSADVLELLGLEGSQLDVPIVSVDRSEERVLQAFPLSGRASTSRLVQESGLETQEVESALVGLALRGAVALKDDVWRRL